MASPASSPATAGACAPAAGKEAFDADVAPQVVLEATHAVTLHVVSLADLKQHAFRPH
jgi:uncharacterized protein (DUF2237 family)